MPLTPVVQGFNLMLKRAVPGSGVTVCSHGVGIDEGMERGISGIMRKKAAAVCAGQLTVLAGVREGEEEGVSLLRMEDGPDLGHKRRAGQRDDGEEEGVRPFAASKQGMAECGLVKKRECIADR